MDSDRTELSTEEMEKIMEDQLSIIQDLKDELRTETKNRDRIIDFLSILLYGLPASILTLYFEIDTYFLNQAAHAIVAPFLCIGMAYVAGLVPWAIITAICRKSASPMNLFARTVPLLLYFCYFSMHIILKWF